MLLTSHQIKAKITFSTSQLQYWRQLPSYTAAYTTAPHHSTARNPGPGKCYVAWQQYVCVCVCVCVCCRHQLPRRPYLLGSHVAQKAWTMSKEASLIPTAVETNS
ncbi:unnamed protein product [Periconia digitata]|uniref:Uncharacterized protein n=1 Tax=Periconia digitata TaxID=1303443 RepID=A0A9W4UGZ7_9PLEO|nr:unnamed protein product [Periconia digitata]